jgi:3-phosphoshikimate 1-carboxyvinyltransferase
MTAVPPEAAIAARPMQSRAGGALAGTLRVPGDKSISHRALMFGALAVGETLITGLLEGEDVMRTATAMRAMGVGVERRDDGSWRVDGLGVGGLHAPAETLYMGNSGTTTRLIAGILAGHGFESTLDGDASLRKRPMGRVVEPLARMGAGFATSDGNRLPMTISGRDALIPIVYETPVASAQVKSAVLLAGLHAPGETSVIERHATRDHTERMLRHFGATVRETPAEGGGTLITITGQPELYGAPVAVPADPSSAAFPAVAALIVAGSDITLPGVGTNPARTGLYTCLAEMGADLEWRNAREIAGEPVADLVLRASDLRGITVPAARAPSMIDEYPILAVAAAFAEGDTVMQGLGELRVKESDRLSAIARGLTACGVAVEEGADSLIVHGRSHGGRAGAPPAGGATIETELDHRLAMSFLVLGLATQAPVAVDDATPIETSFPGFAAALAALGADIGDID